MSDPRDADPPTVRYLACPVCGLVDGAYRPVRPNPDPLTVDYDAAYAAAQRVWGPQFDRDRPGITIPLLVAIVVVVAVALAAWGGTRP